MKITILGNGSATPILARRPSAAVLEEEGESILIDCGEGTQYQLLKYKIKLSRIKYILITHLHGDHYFGLIGLLMTINHTGRKDPLILIAPRGMAEIINIQMKHARFPLNYYINHISTNPDKFEEIFSDEKLTISTVPLRHRIPCTGFIIEQKPKGRKILAEKLPDDFPVEYFKLLKDGLDVTDEKTNTVYKNEEYTTEGAHHKKLAYISDTIYDPEIIKHIKNTDLLYHEATFTNELTERADITFHSTAAQAARIALDSQSKKLLIGHFSSRYKDLGIFRKEAITVFDETYLAEEGKSYEI